METAAPTGKSSGGLDQSDVQLIPGWLRRLAAISWRSLAALGLGAILAFIALQLSTVTVSIVLGAIVAASLAPYVHSLETKRHWSATKAAAVVCLLALVILIVAIAVLVLVFAPYGSELVRLIAQGEEDVRAWILSLGLAEPIITLIEHVVDLVKGWAASAIGELIGPLADLVTVTILSGFLVFFCLQAGERAWTAAGNRMAPWREQILFARGRDALARVGGYLRGTAILAGAHAASDFVFLTLLGVPLAGPMAVLIFALTFVPYVGGITGTVMIVLVAAATIGINGAIVLFVLVSITNFILNSILRPIVYGRTVKIHPALVFIALPVGAALFGVVGLFIALPTLAFLMAIVPGLIQVLSSGEDHADQHPLVPLWLERLGAWSWRGIVIIALLAIVIRAVVLVPLVVVPVVLSVVFAATLSPAVAILEKRGRGRTASALIATAGMVIVIAVILVISLLSIVNSLPPIFDTAADGAQKPSLEGVLLPLLAAMRSGLLGSIGDLFSTLADVAVGLFLTLVLTFYLLRDGAKWGREFLAQIDSPIRRARLSTAGGDSVGVLSGYMVGTGVISAVGALSQWLIMFVLGIPFAAPLAVLSFFGGFIPYIGSALTTGLALLVTIAVGSPTDIVVMIVFTAVFNIVQGNIVAPLVYSKAVNLHPAVVLLAIPAGAAIAGIIGMFLVVPVLGVIATSWSAVLHAFDPDDMLVAAPSASGSTIGEQGGAAEGSLIVPGVAGKPAADASLGTASADANS